MKALILAAGLGTRLQPYTNHTPKPLFTISDRPLLDIMISRLIEAGCEAIIINTHHLHERIESYIAQQAYAIPVLTRFEPQILGTGGAIRNVRDFWNDRPFMVINGDIVTTIDFKLVYDFHCRHLHPTTLVLTDDPEFNTVASDAEGFIVEFQHRSDAVNRSGRPALTFTGIQVLDPEILKFIPDGTPSSSIDAYTRMLAKGKKIKAFISKNAYWKDIGTAKRYKLAVFETLTPRIFQQVFPGAKFRPPVVKHLEGDGSDRRWNRLTVGTKSMIVVDHQIKIIDKVDEADAFINIGRHLFDRGLPVPQIYGGDAFAGYVFLEDLGNLDLQTAVQKTDNWEKITRKYQSVIDLLVQFSAHGARQFNAAWTYQTGSYDKPLILEKECRYFVDAFLNAYLGLEIIYEDFKKEFEFLAENALKYAVQGLMHRDFQSRNIMIKHNQFYFIDFQGSRMGPIQYDLASLLIDPYVDLPPQIQTRLCTYALKKLQAEMTLKAADFRRCYRFCRLTRNLQILGAFGYLTCIKKKAHFEKYIPVAVKTLRRNLLKHENKTLPGLAGLAEKISKHDRIQNFR
jgi:aminoglycoside/choline kinase family phosphotransferase/dTDP-glucose pyrophosphorylase